MQKTKFLLATVLVALLVIVPLKGALAGASTVVEAPPEVISGVIESITVEVDETTQEVTVVVVLVDSLGGAQTVHLSAETAVTLGLVTLETISEEVFVPNPLMTGETIHLDPLTVLPEEGVTPPPPDVLIEGVVQSVEVLVDELTDETSVLVTLLMTTPDGEVAGSYRISIETALALGLGSLEPQTVEEFVPVEAMIGQALEINPEDVLPEEDEDQSNPVAELLGNFFANLFGVDPEVVITYHEQGMGYGVIAQAGVLAYALEGDGSLMQTILDAKQSGDYNAIILPDGTTAENWGQLRKAIMEQENSLKNLGQIVSGHADEVQTGPVEEDVVAGETDESDTAGTELQDETKHPGRPENPGKPEDKNKTNHGHGH
ncbi:MAG: hypothetical protein HY781_13210 [Chloroflexi bacterium]|nr:hypothetical protein [Chloroflexota bacterium]